MNLDTDKLNIVEMRYCEPLNNTMISGGRRWWFLLINDTLTHCGLSFILRFTFLILNICAAVVVLQYNYDYLLGFICFYIHHHR
uniref:Uncharacterized protein n=1 Tax=Glossina palpalis gambiensis TaxID=67801 RepID=A0A1B0B068_9MUSC